MRCIPISLSTLVLVTGAAMAAPPPTQPPRVAAEQLLIESPANTDIGGSASQRFAQVFQLPADGYLSHVMVPANCASARVLRVEIERTTAGVPNGVVVARQDVPGPALNAYGYPVPGMRMIEFIQPALLSRGEYAFTLTVSALRRNEYCMLWLAPPGDTYLSGKAYFIARGNPPNWIELFDAAGTPRDLAFQVFVRPL
ncbi:MAG: hypothetical protein JNJ62_00880 [Pseudoxanthomonas mexicana]|jgi:hypothetical protein|uniref:hypothetical protein n=1 Tax=Pseudoxanthomonas mexicana TaxID=128785 RepID=UPI000785AAB4|nr:hypothetical protein [Pseudoxanthomonas mexicana]MBL8255135.1 hypothetical protein [Pseudoxanthomonas mexicana]